MNSYYIIEYFKYSVMMEEDTITLFYSFELFLKTTQL